MRSLSIYTLFTFYFFTSHDIVYEQVVNIVSNDDIYTNTFGKSLKKIYTFVQPKNNTCASTIKICTKQFIKYIL